MSYQNTTSILDTLLSEHNAHILHTTEKQVSLVLTQGTYTIILFSFQNKTNTLFSCQNNTNTSIFCLNRVKYLACCPNTRQAHTTSTISSLSDPAVRYHRCRNQSYFCSNPTAINNSTPLCWKHTAIKNYLLKPGVGQNTVFMLLLLPGIYLPDLCLNSHLI